MRRIQWTRPLTLLVWVLIAACGAPSDEPAPEGGGAGSSEGPPAVQAETPGPTTIEYTGRLTASGTEGLRAVDLRTGDGVVVGLVGPLLDELVSLSGADVTVRGADAAGAAPLGLDVAEYDVLAIDGQIPAVGVLQNRNGMYVLENGDVVQLTSVPEALAQELGAKVWVTGGRTADGQTVQSFGVIRPR